MKPLILIGAARSGTKLLRDLLAEHERVAAVPFDVNYLWRIGNEAADDDELRAPLPRRAKQLVSRELNKRGVDVVVEKTVSNCLRIPAVFDTFANADFVFLTRDGYDVTESAMRQWQAPVDWRYTLRKAAQYPWLRAPGYALRHVRSLAMRPFESTMPSWGPRYPGIDADVTGHPLHIVCAKQWAACTHSAIRGFDEVGAAPVVVRYADLVAEPLETLNRVYTRCGLAPVGGVRQRVRADEVGKGRRSLPPEVLGSVGQVVDPVQAVLDAWIAGDQGST